MLIDSELGTTEGGELHMYRGRTQYQAPDVDACTILMAEEPLSIGELVHCKVIDSDGYDIIARPFAEFEKVISLPLR